MVPLYFTSHEIEAFKDRGAVLYIRSVSTGSAVPANLKNLGYRAIDDPSKFTADMQGTRYPRLMVPVMPPNSVQRSSRSSALDRYPVLCPWSSHRRTVGIRESCRLVWDERDQPFIEYRDGYRKPIDSGEQFGATKHEIRALAGGHSRPWRSSSNAPTCSVRFSGTIKTIRLSRLGDLTEMDAIDLGLVMVSRGVEPSYCVPGRAPRYKHYTNPFYNGGAGVDIMRSMQTYWEAIVPGSRSWDQNQWVWALMVLAQEPGGTQEVRQETKGNAR